MSNYQFKPKGVCSTLIEIDVDGDTVKSVNFVGGCSGNLQGISVLSKGEKMSVLIEKLGGINCGGKATSCPDQLSKALKELVAKLG